MGTHITIALTLNRRAPVSEDVSLIHCFKQQNHFKVFVLMLSVLVADSKSPDFVRKCFHRNVSHFGAIFRINLFSNPCMILILLFLVQRQSPDHYYQITFIKKIYTTDNTPCICVSVKYTDVDNFYNVTKHKFMC